MGIAPLPVCDLVALKSRLYVDDYSIEVPITQWQNSQCVRISIHGHTDPLDVDAFFQALASLLPQVSSRVS